MHRVPIRLNSVLKTWCMPLCPVQVLALEDSPAGVRAAVAAKLPAVGLATSRPKESLIEAGAVIAVTDYEELMALIETQEQTQAEAQAAAES